MSNGPRSNSCSAAYIDWQGTVMRRGEELCTSSLRLSCQSLLHHGRNGLLTMTAKFYAGARLILMYCTCSSDSGQFAMSLLEDCQWKCISSWLT